MNIDIIPILKDNYAYLLTTDNGETAIVDPGEAAPIIAFLEERTLGLNYIFNTHHHGDHTHGNEELAEKYKARLIAPAAEEDKISYITLPVHDGDKLSFGGENFTVIATPGHTAGAVCYYFPDSQAVFTGDTLFSMSTGRLFEGTAEDMWASLQKLAALPENTRVYCGHEYTLNNGLFAQTIEPKNLEIQNRLKDVRALREKNLPSLPSTIGLEKQTNVFMRAGSALNFAHIRALKDAA